MLILGIESSCDETSAAVVRDGREIVSNVVATQIDEHRLYGGVVPEIASRRHIENIVPVTQQALQQAGASMEVMLVPMGILYPIARGNRGFGMTVLVGFIFSMAIEVMQPLLHAERCFDITDIITNTMGAALGFAVLTVFRPLLALLFPRALGRKKRKKN